MAGGAEASEAASAPASSAQEPSAEAPGRLQVLAVQDAQSAVYLMTSGGFQLARLQTSLPAPCSLVRLSGPFSMLNHAANVQSSKLPGTVGLCVLAACSLESGGCIRAG